MYGRPRYWDEDLEEDASLDGGARRPGGEYRAAADSTHME
jgi:hypothetical protein